MASMGRFSHARLCYFPSSPSLMNDPDFLSLFSLLVLSVSVSVCSSGSSLDIFFLLHCLCSFPRLALLLKYTICAAAVQLSSFRYMKSLSWRFLLSLLLSLGLSPSTHLWLWLLSAHVSSIMHVTGNERFS